MDPNQPAIPNQSATMQPPLSPEARFEQVLHKPKNSPYLLRIFEGRMNRQNYSIGSLLLVVFPFLCFMLFFGSIATSPAKSLLINPYDTAQLESAALEQTNMQASFNSILTSPINITLAILLVIYIIVSIPYVFAFQARRLHDMDKSGWLMLLGLVPIVSYVFPLYVAFASGTKGDNKYGPQPLPRTNILEDMLCIPSKKATPPLPNETASATIKP